MVRYYTSSLKIINIYYILRNNATFNDSVSKKADSIVIGIYINTSVNVYFRKNTVESILNRLRPKKTAEVSKSDITTHLIICKCSYWGIYTTFQIQTDIKVQFKVDIFCLFSFQCSGWDYIF